MDPAILRVMTSGFLAATLIKTGACAFEHLHHGALFHASTKSVSMDLVERFKLIPYEIAVGLVIVSVSTIIQFFIMSL